MASSFRQKRQNIIYRRPKQIRKKHDLTMGYIGNVYIIIVIIYLFFILIHKIWLHGIFL